MLLREVCKNILFLVMDAGRALSAPSTKAKVIIFIKKQTHTHTHKPKTDTIQKLRSTKKQKVLSKPEKKTKVQKVPEKRGARLSS